MHRSLRLAVLSPCLLIALLAAAVFPMTAFAEEATPPPPVEETTVPEGDSPAEGTDVGPTEPAPTEVVTEVAPSELPSTEVAPTEAPTDVLPAEATSTESLTALPEGTEVVVLDSSGEPVPLATNEAAEIIAGGDPVWCPGIGGGATLPGGDGCTDYATTFTGEDGLLENMGDLLIGCVAPGPCPLIDGTIYVEEHYDSEDEEADEIVIDIADLNEYVDFGDLLIQGGWDFATNTHPAGAYSEFNLPLAIEWAGDVTLNDLVFYYPEPSGDSDAGLFVETEDGDIALNTVSVYGSEGSGAILDNCGFEEECESTGDVTVNDSTFNYNEEVGLIVDSFGDITLTGVTANGNEEIGALLLNYNEGNHGERSEGDVTVRQSTFGAEGEGDVEGNGGTGLEIESFGDITLVDVYAGFNGWWDQEGFGIDAGTEGGGVSIRLENVTAEYNGTLGLLLNDEAVQECGFVGLSWVCNDLTGPAAGITLIDVTASHNGEVGAVLETDGSLWVDPSHFDDNGMAGLLVSANDGVVDCSTFIDNGLVGLGGEVDGTLTVSGCSFSGNGLMDIYVSGNVVVLPDCGTSGGGGVLGVVAGPGYHTVNVSGGESVGLDCAAYAGTILMLANGDHAVLPCPIGENATLQPGSQAALPGALDGGLTFVSSVELGVTQNGQAVESLGGTIGIHFSIPGGTDGAGLSVLHWDGGQWEKLSGSVSPDGYFEVPHDETGLFVLVSG